MDCCIEMKNMDLIPPKFRGTLFFWGSFSEDKYLIFKHSLWFYCGWCNLIPKNSCEEMRGGKTVFLVRGRRERGPGLLAVRRPCLLLLTLEDCSSPKVFWGIHGFFCSYQCKFSLFSFGLSISFFSLMPLLAPQFLSNRFSCQVWLTVLGCPAAHILVILCWNFVNWVYLGFVFLFYELVML